MGSSNNIHKVESTEPRPKAGSSRRVGTNAGDGASRGDSSVSRRTHLRPKTYIIVVNGDIPTDLPTRISVIHAKALLKTSNVGAPSPTAAMKSKNVQS